jgi:hypothetical protein
MARPAPRPHQDDPRVSAALTPFRNRKPVWGVVLVGVGCDSDG